MAGAFERRSEGAHVHFKKKTLNLKPQTLNPKQACRTQGVGPSWQGKFSACHPLMASSL